MKKILFTICCCAALALNAQTPTFDWAINLGGINYDRGFEIVTDAAGDVYVAGIISGTGDFDPGSGVVNLVSNGNDDMFIAKYTAAGSLVWAYNIGGTGNEVVTAMAIDASGSCYITGRFAGTVDFDPGAGTSTITASGPFDVYIVKLNTSGNLLWAKNFGGTFGTFVNDLSIDASGSVYTIGTSQATTDFDPSAAVYELVSTGGQDPYMAKLDASGNFVWALNTGFSISALNIDINNALYLTGIFNDTTDFDFDTTQTINLISLGGSDIYIAKFDTDANFVWVKSVGGTDNESPGAINTDAVGNIIICGTFVGTADFDPGAGIANLTAVGTGSNLSDMFFLKLDAAGNYVWAKRIGGNSIDFPTDIDTDNAGNVYFCGQFKSSVVDFDPDPTVTFNLNGTFSSYDAFVLILSTTGNFIYAYEIGGPSNGDDEAGGIFVNPSCSFYVTGSFYGPIDFDPGTGTNTLTGNGNTDAYVQKMNITSVGLADLTDENSFILYPNPASTKCIVQSSRIKVGDVIRIFDVMGKEILTLNNVEQEIDLSNFQNGIYFVTILSGNVTAIQKLIIQH